MKFKNKLLKIPSTSEKLVFSSVYEKMCYANINSLSNWCGTYFIGKTYQIIVYIFKTC
jgi:hypothetical protein